MLKLAPGLVFGVARQMHFAIFRNGFAALVDENGCVVPVGFSVLDRKFSVTQAKPDAQFAGEVEQRARLRPRHLVLEESIDFRLILHKPARKKRRQRKLGIDDQIAAIGVRLAHECRQPCNNLGPGFAPRNWAELADCDVHKSCHDLSFAQTPRFRG